MCPFTESFNDRFVCTLAQVANLKELTSGLEELRFVATKITGAGVAQLTSLLPDVKITAVSADEWIRNPETNNPAFNLETGHLDAAVEENEIDDSYDVEAELMKRFGQLPPGFTSKKAK